ncbi:hypothetical protein AMAG_20112 [Allomyces macrogynus ATCC 38327]|uniref:Uncharacterized protein n=1 Tax=Allomyces macrogynus (strain ATCC 38327) TaxID=578462 RepID=A0A0L0T6R0_ALLM3|nr:hypothetical protein AMAG_20112 [Allomyces macrogynus ATCC 38327]|eukprot:KNE70432.1 hypothetical protein AMAG_20112 [Allomyces macrogynus ATCC 38327]
MADPPPPPSESPEDAAATVPPPPPAAKSPSPEATLAWRTTDPAAMGKPAVDETPAVSAVLVSPKRAKVAPAAVSDDEL